MSVSITTLSENTASGGGFLAEWGLSLLIEVGQTTILVDTGLMTKSIGTNNCLIWLNRKTG